MCDIHYISYEPSSATSRNKSYYVRKNGHRRTKKLLLPATILSMETMEAPTKTIRSHKRNLYYINDSVDTIDSIEFPPIQWEDSANGNYSSEDHEDGSNSSDDDTCRAFPISSQPPAKRHRGLLRSQKFVAKLDTLSHYCDVLGASHQRQSCLLFNDYSSLLEQLHV